MLELMLDLLDCAARGLFVRAASGNFLVRGAVLPETRAHGVAHGTFIGVSVLPVRRSGRDGD